MSNTTLLLSAWSVTTKPLTVREQKLVNELVTVHGVRHSSAIYVSDSMTGYSWTCRVNFGGWITGHLFSVTIPIDESKRESACEKFYAKVRTFKAALDAAIARNGTIHA